MIETVDSAVFEKILERCEPRAPLLHLELEQPSNVKTAWQCMVEVRFYDNLSCDLLHTYKVDPFSALLLMHRAGRFSVDGTLCDDMVDFSIALYDIVNAHAAMAISNQALPAPVVTPCTIQFGDMVQLMREAIDTNGGACGVELDGARWVVS